MSREQYGLISLKLYDLSY